MEINGGSVDSSAPIYRDGEHVVVVCRNAVLTYSRSGPNPRFLEAWDATVERIVHDFNAPLLAMTIIESGAKPPDEDCRRRIRSTLDRNAERIGGFAYVVEGEGFGAAAIRSALSLITMAARFPFPLKVFGHVEDAVPWLLKRPSVAESRAPGAVQLVSAAQFVRGHLRAVAAAGSG